MKNTGCSWSLRAGHCNNWCLMTLCFMGKYKELFSYLQTGEVNRKYIQEKHI